MALGNRMYRLWQFKAGLVFSLLVALFVAVMAVDRPSLSPLGLTPRALTMASALTHVFVDTPSSSMIDLREDTYALAEIQDRAVVLGNVVANGAVETAIAKRAGVPITALRVQAPLTPAQTEPQVNSQGERHVTDILKFNDQYRLVIQVNTTIPMLDIYAQTPTAASAAALANAAVFELRAYVRALAAREHVPRIDQVRIDQLGAAQGKVINAGIRWQVALLAFVLTFAVALASAVYFARVRAGWREAAADSRRATTPRRRAASLN